MARHILHVDCNAFYASVEQQRRPELRGKPVAVCGSQEARHGIVLTASYPAKRRGVRTGMAVWQARQVCPELTVLPPDLREYIRISRMAREIYETYTDQVEPFGLDECWLDVTGSTGLYGGAMEIAGEIRERIKFELGITVSIGVANDKVLAKLGSDYRKPDAVTRIERDNIREVAGPLPVEDLLCVGPATGRKLRAMGVTTIGALAETPPELLAGKLGKMGLILSAFANGLDTTPVRRTDHIAAVKSVGNSATAPRDLTCDEDVWLMLLLLSESVAARMRELSSRCTVVEVSVRDAELCSFVRQRKLGSPTCASQEIAQTAMDLFRASYRWPRPVRSVGVRGAGLVPLDGCVQLSLFLDERRRARRERLDRTVDELRARYGYPCLRRAVLDTDPQLGAINPKDDHTVHPVGYFSA